MVKTSSQEVLSLYRIFVDINILSAHLSSTLSKDVFLRASLYCLEVALSFVIDSLAWVKSYA